MIKFARSDEPKVNKCQIKSKAPIPNPPNPPFAKGGQGGIINWFGVYHSFDICLPAGRQGFWYLILGFDLFSKRSKPSDGSIFSRSPKGFSFVERAMTAPYHNGVEDGQPRFSSHLSPMFTIFWRDLNPATIEISDWGRLKYSAKVSITSLFALFSLGGAFTLTKNWLWPISSTLFSSALGFTLIEIFIWSIGLKGDEDFQPSLSEDLPLQRPLYNKRLTFSKSWEDP